MGKKFFATSEAELLAAANEQVRAAYLLMKEPPLYELYDLQSDPFEFKNLADNPVHAMTRAQLIQALMLWQKDTEDPLKHPKLAHKLFNMIRDAGTAKRKALDYKAFMKIR